MPASSVNEEMLEVLRKNEQEQIDRLLSQYKASCGKVVKDFVAFVSLLEIRFRGDIRIERDPALQNMTTICFRNIWRF